MNSRQKEIMQHNLAITHPELAREWHPTKNKKLLPTEVTAGSNGKIWWLLPYDDPRTGKHFDFEWQATILSRVHGAGCPYLSGQAVWKGFNDLASINPKLAKEWNYKKNYPLTPEDVTVGSLKKVWWYLPYDDPKSGKHFDFEWEAIIKSRTQGRGCPYLSNKVIWQGFNDLVTTNPELAREWHPTKNGDLRPEDVTAGSNRIIWWYLPYDDLKMGKHYDFEWKASVVSRSQGRGKCPFLK